MAKKRRVFFWTKVETDMWHDRRIKRLRRADHGAEYILIYLMLTTETANSGFTYVYEGLDDDIETEIALAIDADEDMVKDAIAWYVRLGMAELSEDRQTLTLYADRVGISVGSETNFARDKRDQRDQRKDKREDNVLPGGDNVLPREDNVLPEGRKCPTEKEKSKSKSKEVKVKKVPAGKPADIPVPDGVNLDEELPFGNTDFAPVKAPADIDKKIKIVVDAWNRVVDQVKADGVQVASAQTRTIVPGKPRYDLLLPLLERYGTEVMVRCFDAYPQTDWWMGKGSNPQYEGVVNGFDWLLRHWEEFVLPRADALQLIRQVPDDGDGHYVVDNAASRESARQYDDDDEGFDFGQ